MGKRKRGLRGDDAGTRTAGRSNRPLAPDGRRITRQQLLAEHRAREASLEMAVTDGAVVDWEAVRRTVGDGRLELRRNHARKPQAWAQGPFLVLDTVVEASEMPVLFGGAAIVPDGHPESPYREDR